MMTTTRLPAEWEAIDGVLLAWPHADSDWGPVLAEVEPVFAQLGAAISRHATLVLLCQDSARCRALLTDAGARADRMQLIEDIPTNDTWVRDYGPITVYENDSPVLLDCGFNGWGLKFPAFHDNQVTRRLHAKKHLHARLRTLGLWLEGGAIETDGRGTMLTTSRCLLSPNRQPHWRRRDYEAVFADTFGCDRTLWLDHGELQGDDTDAHIDTLARFAPHDTIIHVACDDSSDSHFAGFQHMQEQLQALRNRRNQPYRLLPLPWPAVTRAADGHRTPATYANYLVCNDAVLVPSYRQGKKDTAAQATIASAHPGCSIEAIDCLPLLQQHGSLHCCCMQLPRGVLG